MEEHLLVESIAPFSVHAIHQSQILNLRNSFAAVPAAFDRPLVSFLTVSVRFPLVPAARVARVDIDPIWIPLIHKLIVVVVGVSHLLLRVLLYQLIERSP